MAGMNEPFPVLCPVACFSMCYILTEFAGLIISGKIHFVIYVKVVFFESDIHDIVYVTF